MVVKAIFFDMDGVLVHVSISPVQFLMKIYQELGLHFSLEQVSDAYEKAEKWWSESSFSDYRLRTRDAFIQYNHKILKLLGEKDESRRLSEKVQSHWENLSEEADEKLYAEVKDVLRRLKEKQIVLAVLSNRLLTFSLKSLEKHNIRGYFRYVICPQTAGAPKGKESPEMWQYALNRIGVKPNQTLHVDDKYEQILGAKQAGIRPVLIDRKGIYSSVIGFFVIHDLTEIFELL
jgi:HAD superfamily hydrolase (TIGR01509 family)